MRLERAPREGTYTCRGAHTYMHHQRNPRAGRRAGSGRTCYKPEIDSFHVRRDAGRHGRQGAERAVHFAGDVAGARARAGARGWRARPGHDQHHGQCSPGRPRWHLVGVRGPGKPAGGGATTNPNARMVREPCPRLQQMLESGLMVRDASNIWLKKLKRILFFFLVVKVHLDVEHKLHL